MKRLLYILPAILLFALGMYTYNNREQNNIEVAKLQNDSISDYDSIIIKRGRDDEKLIALTFDDGPDEDFTPQILDILKKYNIKATFFVMGQKVGWNPDIVKRQHEEGHEIGNHTFTHINVSKRGYAEIEKEIVQTQQIVKDTIGEEPKIFRPPYRAISKNMCDIVKDKHMNIILWSNLDPRDWSNPGVGNICNTIVNKVQNGSIILLHDYNSVRNSKSQTVQALDEFIPKLQEKGYKFVTISEMIEHLGKGQETQN